MDAKDIAKKVDQILANRKKLLPKIDDNINTVKNQIDQLEKIQAALDKLKKLENDIDAVDQLTEADKEIDEIIGLLIEKEALLAELQAEFTRETLNIGVSGGARVGKSTTLQKFTGLTDVQIPTGKGLPVTAVRSEMINQGKGRAEIEFRDQDSFIDEFIGPHLKNINKHLGIAPISIESISDLRSVPLPPNLGNGITPEAGSSLEALRAAQKGLDSYAELLDGGKIEVPLKELRPYVAYPTDGELKREDEQGIPAERKYLAVKYAKIFTSFPDLGNAKIGLVDLPGLGEIGESAANIHLKGLEDKVDHVFLILKPTPEKGHLDQGISENINQLLKVQPGVKRRSDLITVGINVEEGAESSAQSLRGDFERKINDAQKSDKYELLDYDAIDPANVSGLFFKLLNKLTDRLPDMDEQKIGYVLNRSISESRIHLFLDDLSDVLSEMLSHIPLPDAVMLDQIDKVSRDVIKACKKFELSLSRQASSSSKVDDVFRDDVEGIFKTVKEKIESGFFRGSKEEWESRVGGHVDDYAFYRAEARRLRCEIIAAYSKLDKYYGKEIEKFKSEVLDTFLGNAGDILDYFNFAYDESSDSKINKVKIELKAITRDKDVDEALSLLEDTCYTFRGNVFLNIEKHLENLANPDDSVPGYRNAETKRNTLGGLVPEIKLIEELHMYLLKDANDANDGIRKSLLEQNDGFNRYLAISVSFFNDFLFRKDKERFKQVVIRSLIRKYPDCFYDRSLSESIDSKKKNQLESILKQIKESRDGKLGGTSNKARKKESKSKAKDIRDKESRNAGSKVSSAKQAWARSYSVESTHEGEVKRISDPGIFVRLGKYDALIPSCEISSNEINTLNVGQSVKVKVIETNLEKGQVTLSLL